MSVRINGNFESIFHFCIILEEVWSHPLIAVHSTAELKYRIVINVSFGIGMNIHRTIPRCPLRFSKEYEQHYLRFLYLVYGKNRSYWTNFTAKNIMVQTFEMLTFSFKSSNPIFFDIHLFTFDSHEKEFTLLTIFRILNFINCIKELKLKENWANVNIRIYFQAIILIINRSQWIYWMKSKL